MPATTILRPILTFVLLLAMAPSAVAQFPGMPRPGAAKAPAQPPQRLAAEIAVYDGHLILGRDATIGVVLTVQPKWKIQAGLGSGDEVDPYIPTTIDLTLPDGWTAGTVMWPEAKPFVFGEGEWAETLMVYDGRTLAAVPITVPADAAPGEYEIEATIGFQACDDQMCDMPTSITVRSSLRVVSEDHAGDAPELNEATTKLFLATLGRQHPAPPADAPATDDALAFSSPSFFGITVPRVDGVLGLLLLALFSAIGGFVLNLTPCVLPVIPIKIMTILQHANAPGRNLVLGLWMAAGVVAFWAGIGLPVAFFAGVTDPSQLFGIWWVTFGIGALIALMGVGIMGMFTIQLPNAVYAVNPKADSAGGSFAFGVMTAVLGLPCFGFVAGALLAGAATLPPSTVMVIFTSLGVGMALPYIVLSAKPSLVERIPRTGPASELVKQVMGLLLLAAAAYFIGSGLVALVSEKPYLSRQLHWWAVALFALMAGLWLIVRTFQITPKFGPRLSFLVMGVLFGGIATMYAMSSTSNARVNWELHQAALAERGGDGFVPGAWNDYTAIAFDRAREAGHVIVLDFTAEWCINCKVLKASVLNRDPVASQLARDDVVSFTVDLTSQRAPGWTFLREGLGQTGIPLLAIYGPDDDTPWQSNAYTPQQVMAALEQARTQRLAQR